MKLEITKEKVLQAAKTSEAAKEMLKELFPEVFELELAKFHVSETGLYNSAISLEDIISISCTTKSLLLSKKYLWNFVGVTGNPYYSHEITATKK